jgi:hypothetical protein
MRQLMNEMIDIEPFIVGSVSHAIGIAKSNHDMILINYHAESWCLPVWVTTDGPPGPARQVTGQWAPLTAGGDRLIVFTSHV